MTLVLVLALVVAFGFLARERRRARAFRGRYIGRVVVLRAKLRETEDDLGDVRDQLLLATLRSGDSTCALDVEPLPIVNPSRHRREYPS